jgi:transposase
MRQRLRQTCRRKRFAVNRRSVKRSPFRTLDRLHAAEQAFHRGASIGFTARSSLKSMGRIPRKNGCYVLGTKYR